MIHQTIRSGWVISLFAIGLTTTATAAPTINKLSLRGLQIGGTTVITIDGTDLLPDPQIILPVKVAQQTVKPNGNTKRVEIEVTLDPQAEPGIYQFRLATLNGVSNPMMVGVDSLPQQPFAEELSQLPVALHGSLVGNKVLRTKFTGRKGQQIVADVESRRLGGNMNPLVRVFDARGTQLAWSASQRNIAGDARCEVTLPADGQYTVQLQDAMYRGPQPGLFRLKIGDLHYADMVFPMGAQHGTKTALAFVSTNLSADARVTAEVSSEPVSIQRAPWPPLAAITGASPRLVTSPHPEIMEQPIKEGALQVLPAPPVAISGRIAQDNQEDRYLFTVQPGSKLRFQVFARRLGSPLDGVLQLRDEQGKTLARSDDQQGTLDPGLNYTVPSEMSKIVLAVKDLQGRGGKNFIYRVAVARADKPDFELSIDDNRVNVPLGGSVSVQVRASRSGYTGPIHLNMLGLPEGVRIAGSQIVPGSNSALMTLSAASGNPTHGIGRIVGSTSDLSSQLARIARLAETPVSRCQPWLRGELGWAVTQAGPIRIDWAAPDAKQRLIAGGMVTVKLKLSRSKGVQGSVRLALLTNQAIPKKQVPNPKDKKKTIAVDDLDRALRLEGKPELAADATEMDVNVLVPADLAALPWDLVLKAELLSADKKSVVAAATSSLLRMPSVRPLSLQLTGQASVLVTAGGNTAGVLMGKLTRMKDFQSPVTVALVGLPKGYSTPQVVVPGDQNNFALAVIFPKGTKAGELKDVRLVATAPLDPKPHRFFARSSPIPVKITVVVKEKPPAK